MSNEQRIVTTEEELFALWDEATEAGGFLPVVLDNYHTPWILYETEHAFQYAHTVPSDDPDDKATLTWDALLAEQHGKGLLVLWNGVPKR